MIEIYKASAGSGKTFTLVREYLKLLLGVKGEDGRYRLDERPHDNHRRILAVTFTNKATDEMKKRIVKELDTLADPAGNSPYSDFLVKTFATTSEKLRRGARAALVALLQDFTNFNVSTIDTFFQKILRTFAYESNLSGNYGVELDDGYAIAVGVSDLKQSLRLNGGRDSRMLIGWLEQFIMANINADKTWDVFRPSSGKGDDNSLAAFAKSISKEAIKQRRKELFDYLADKTRISDFACCLREAVGRLEESVRGEAALMLGILSADGVVPDRHFKARLEALCDRSVPLSVPESADKDWVAKKLEKPKFVNKSSAPVSDIDLAESLERVGAAFAAMRSYNLILDNIYYLGLLGDIDAHIRRFTAENNVVLLSGTNEMLRRIINKDDAPFIYERIGMRLSHFLIDEFQDTSRMQWNNMRPLLENSLAGGNDSLIIGDVKQSIYRFRNSDPELLRTQVKADFRGNFREEGGDAESNTNWRSSANVVAWNNAFFSSLSAKLGMADVYDNVVQRVCEGNRENPGHVAVVRLDAEKTDDFEAAALDCLIANVNNLMDRGYEQKDIAVIVNRNGEGQAVIDKILNWNNGLAPGGRKLNVVSEESMLIAKSPAVRIIVNILAMLDNYEGSSGRKGGGEVRLPVILKNYEANVSRGMDSSEALSKAMEEDAAVDLRALFGSGECAGLDTIAEQIVRTQLSPELVEENTPYIQAFMDNLIDFMGRYGSNVHAFLKWWDTKGKTLSISSPDNTNAIRVMTIHKSKGLEFPCVILPFFTWKIDLAKDLEWIAAADVDGLPDGADAPPLFPVRRKAMPTIFDAQFERARRDSVMDSLNKTYVACTRAVEELILFYPSKIQSGTVASLLDDFVGLSGGLREDGEGKALFEMGGPTVKTAGREVADSEREERTMPPYKVAYNPEIWHFDSPEIVAEVRGTKRYRGEVLHRLMRRVRVAGDLERALSEFRVKGIISAEEASDYRVVLERGLADRRVAPWFAPGNRLLAERPIADGRGSVYRPDRVVCRPGGAVVVVDYKFGERQDRKYARQVRNYVSIIRAARGGGDVRGYIWYVEDGEIVEVE